MKGYTVSPCALASSFFYLLTDFDVMNSLSESQQNHTPLMFRLHHEQAEE